jgi:TPR repeat protein
MRRSYALLGAVFLLVMSSPYGWAQYDDGVAAYRKGDYSSARHAFETAANGGDGDALMYLSFMYEQGCGVTQDGDKAHSLLHQAVTANSAAAKYWFVLLKAFTGGKNVDIAHLNQLMQEAAQGGDPPAMGPLGETYLSGTFVPADPVKACAWQSLALRRSEKALGGHVGVDSWWTGMQDALKRTEAKLSQEQVTLAKQLAEDLDRSTPDARPGTLEVVLHKQCQ